MRREGLRRTDFSGAGAGVIERYQRRTTRLAAQIGAVVRELAGRAACRVLDALAVRVSRHTALLRLPLPQVSTPRVLGVDDFAIRKGHTYATILIDAVTRRRVDVLSDRKADTVEAWLREHPGVEIVCRDSSSAYAQAVRRVLPEATQVTDRWHVWANLGEAVLKEVACHSSCWAAIAQPRESRQAKTTMERWHQVHALLDKGVGLLECARRLQLALNTVKRYARAVKPERMVRAPSTAPLWSTRTATTCVAAGSRILPPLTSTCSARSRPWATPAASTCCLDTSPKAVSKTTAAASHPAA